MAAGLCLVVTNEPGTQLGSPVGCPTAVSGISSGTWRCGLKMGLMRCRTVYPDVRLPSGFPNQTHPFDANRRAKPSCRACVRRDGKRTTRRALAGALDLMGGGCDLRSSPVLGHPRRSQRASVSEGEATLGIPLAPFFIDGKNAASIATPPAAMPVTEIRLPCRVPWPSARRLPAHETGQGRSTSQDLSAAWRTRKQPSGSQPRDRSVRDSCAGPSRVW